MSDPVESTPCSVRRGETIALFAFDGAEVRLAISTPDGMAEIALAQEDMRKLLEAGWRACGEADRGALLVQPRYKPAGPAVNDDRTDPQDPWG